MAARWIYSATVVANDVALVNQHLKERADEGWELVSGAPAFQHVLCWRKATEQDFSSAETRETEPVARLAYRVSDIQEALGIGRDLVYDLIKSGQLGSVKAGKAVLVPRHALEKFLHS